MRASSRVLKISMMSIGVLTSVMLFSSCTSNYLTNHTTGTYGVPVTERTIAQRLLDKGIEHTAKVNIYALDTSLEQSSRIHINSFFSTVLLTGEVPTEQIKTEIGQVVASMPDVKQVHNELHVGAKRSHSYGLQEGYITSKMNSKVAADRLVKSSQVKMVTNNGTVYVLGRLTPTQQSKLIDIANSTAGVLELVLMTTLVNDAGEIIDSTDVMQESNLSAPSRISTQMDMRSDAGAANMGSQAVHTDAENLSQPSLNLNSENSQYPSNTPATLSDDMAQRPAVDSSGSPYIDLYRQP